MFVFPPGNFHLIPALLHLQSCLWSIRRLLHSTYTGSVQEVERVDDHAEAGLFFGLLLQEGGMKHIYQTIKRGLAE